MARHSVDTMARLLNDDIPDMHMAYGAVNVNARGAALLYPERFPNRHRMFAILRHLLREHESFNENKRFLSACNPSVTILVQAPDMQHVTYSIRMACSQGQPSTSLPYLESAGSAPDRLPSS